MANLRRHEAFLCLIILFLLSTCQCYRLSNSTNSSHVQTRPYNAPNSSDSLYDAMGFANSTNLRFVDNNGTWLSAEDLLMNNIKWEQGSRNASMNSDDFLRKNMSLFNAMHFNETYGNGIYYVDTNNNWVQPNYTVINGSTRGNATQFVKYNYYDNKTFYMPIYSNNITESTDTSSMYHRNTSYGNWSYSTPSYESNWTGYTPGNQYESPNAYNTTSPDDWSYYWNYTDSTYQNGSYPSYNIYNETYLSTTENYWQYQNYTENEYEMPNSYNTTYPVDPAFSWNYTDLTYQNGSYPSYNIYNGTDLGSTDEYWPYKNVTWNEYFPYSWNNTTYSLRPSYWNNSNYTTALFYQNNSYNRPSTPSSWNRTDSTITYYNNGTLKEFIPDYPYNTTYVEKSPDYWNYSGNTYPSSNNNSKNMTNISQVYNVTWPINTYNESKTKWALLSLYGRPVARLNNQTGEIQLINNRGKFGRGYRAKLSAIPGHKRGLCSLQFAPSSSITIPCAALRRPLMITNSTSIQRSTKEYKVQAKVRLTRDGARAPNGQSEQSQEYTINAVITVG